MKREVYAVSWLCGENLVLLVQSESRDDAVHSLIANGRDCFCSCEGYKYHGDCWHKDLADWARGCHEELAAHTA